VLRAALQEKISPKDASLKAYKRIYAPEAPFAAPEPSAPLVMRVVSHTVQNLLSENTALLVETGRQKNGHPRRKIQRTNNAQTHATLKGI
jgi:TPP-dependent 2-oxoacid decarboxylase